MSIDRQALDELVIPSGTKAEERAIVTDADVLVGGRSDIGFAIRGESVLVGEGVNLDGDIEAEGDCRLGMWSSVAGSVLVARDAYLGERVSVDGKLVVGRDLDIGDDVTIDEGFEANGWIVIRNPMPLIVFFIAYVAHVLRSGDEEALEALQDAADAAKAELQTVTDGAPVLLVPRGASITDDVWEVNAPAEIGSECRLNGNLRASRILVDEDTSIYGSLRSQTDISVGAGSTIHGDIVAKHGSVELSPGTVVKGDVRAHDLTLTPDTVIEGTMRARGTVDMHEHAPTA